ncbi:MAG TPA: hypothetical protein VGL27_00540 [Negativicutes bacterium]
MAAGGGAIAPQKDEESYDGLFLLVRSNFYINETILEDEGMGQITMTRRPGSTDIAGQSSGYLLLCNGNYVQRQQNNEQWVNFETLDANFNPEDFFVLNNENQPVRAKFLKHNGDYVLNDKGSPYIVPYTFDLEAFIARYKSLAKDGPSPTDKSYRNYAYEVLRKDFWPGGISDLQRSDNGGVDGPFVISFTASASFVFGLASNNMGIDLDTALWAGGKVNQLQSVLNTLNPWGRKVDTSGIYGNNINNPPNIITGFSYANTPNYKADINSNNNAQAITNSTTPILEPNRFFLEFGINAGDGWDTLEAIYGPKIRDLPEYGTIQNDGNRFRIEVTGDKLAELYYSGKLRLGDKGFAIVGNGRVLSHVTAHFGEEIDPDSVAKLNKIEKDSVKPGQEVTVFLVPSNNTNSSAITSDAVSNKTPTTFEQRWQYNFQTILGPTNPAFIDVTLNSQDFDYNFRLDYNPNGVLWRVNAAGTPHPDDLDRYFEQQKVIEAATNRTISEMQGSGDFPVTSSDLA